MTSTFTPNKNYELQATGDNPNSWGTILNSNVFTIADKNLGGRLSISIAGASNVTPTQSQADNLYHKMTGLLTGNIDYILPNKGGLYIVKNSSTGSFVPTVKPSAGSGFTIPQGQTVPVFVNPDTTSAVAMFDALPSLMVFGSSAPSYGIYRYSGSAIGLSANGVVQAVIGGDASAVNQLELDGSVTGSPVTISAIGSDTNISITLTPKGTGIVNIPTLTVTGSTAPANGVYLQAANTVGISARSLLSATFTNPASAVNYLTFTGSATGNAVAMSAAGSDSNIGVTISGKGTGTIALSSAVTVSQTLTMSAAAINEAIFVSVASASTTNIGAAASNNVNITGTTTITAFDTVAEGITRRCTLGSALTLTYNATTLKLPTSANISGAAGDTFVATSLGGGNWDVKEYQRKDGTSIAFQVPQTTVISSGASNYSTPANAKYLIVKLGGGGGGGGGGGSAGGAGGAGTNTTFSTFTANGGGAGSPSAGTGSNGGGASGGYLTRSGMGGAAPNSLTTSEGGGGGASGEGFPGGSPTFSSSLVIPGNTGAGGGGGASNGAGNPGGGGGGGGYVEAQINAPSGNYAYSVGAGGAAGASGGSGVAGAAGSAGYIIVTAFFQ